MSPRDSRLLLVLGGIVAAVVLFLVLRPAGDDDESATTTATTTEEAAPAQTGEGTTTTGAETVLETAPATTAADEAQQRFAIVLAGGTVTGGIRRWSVVQGERVRIVVRSDVDDELHLHGYDLEKQVGPGRPAIFAFTATLPGRFELEAHHGGGQVAQLDVTP